MTAEEWIAAEWARCAPILQRAIDRNGDTFDADFVWREIAEGRAQMWPAPNSGVISSIRTAPSGLRFLESWLAAGDLHEIVELKPRIEAFGRSQGCTRSIISGRAGWGGAFPDYKTTSILLTKELG